MSSLGWDDTEKPNPTAPMAWEMLHRSLPLPILFLFWNTSGEYKWFTLPKRRDLWSILMLHGSGERGIARVAGSASSVESR
jgi:hypothetical protein